MLGTVFPVGFRARDASRVMRVEARNYHTVAATAPNVAQEVGRLAAHRMSGPAGLQGLASDPVPARAIVLGERTDAACTQIRHFLDRNQVTFEWLTSETLSLDERWGGPAPAPEDRPAVQVIGGKTVVRPQLRRLAELLGARDGAGQSDVRRRDRRRRAGRPRGGRLRRVGRTVDDRRRARGAGRPGRHVFADRELPRLPRRRLRRRARGPRAPAGAAARRGDPRHAVDLAHRRGSASGSPGRRRRAARPHDRARVRRFLAPARHSRVRRAERPRCLLRRVAERRRGNARPRRPRDRCRQLGRSGGDVLLQPCAKRDDRVPRRLAREEHVELSDPAARHAPEHHCSLPQRDRGRRTATVRSRRSTSRTRRAGRSSARRRGASTSSSAPTPKPAGCRPRSRSTAAGSSSPAPTCPQASGRATVTRTCSRRACRGSSRAATSARASSSASPPRSAREAWRSPSSTSTCATSSARPLLPRAALRPSGASPLRARPSAPSRARHAQP